MKLKYHYYVLSVLVLTMTLGIACLNVFVYGSVLKVNLSILPLALVIPLYFGIKQKKYLDKIVAIMWIYLTAVVIISVLVLPRYTYKQAVSEFNQPIETLKKYTGEDTFFHKGNYYIKTENDSYQYGIRNGKITGVENEND